MNRTGARLTRRAVLGGAAAGLYLAAALPASAGETPPVPDDIAALAVDGPSVIAAGDGIWRLDEGGAGWTAVPGGPRGITALAAHPQRKGRLFAGTRAGRVLLSDDDGASWAEAADGLPGGPVTALAIATGDPGTIYAAIERDGLWVSRDAGRSWDLAMDRPFLDGAERDLLTLASVNAETGMGGIWIYAGTEAGLTRVPDCFCRWQDVQPGDAMDALVSGKAQTKANPLPDGDAVLSLVTALQDGAPIYAGLASGIWKSSDAGVNWERINAGPARLVAVDPENPEHLVAVTDAGILSSRDGGLTWTAPAA